MEILDEKVYRNFQEMAGLSPIVKRVAESIDNGELDKRIKAVVTAGFQRIKEDGMGCQLCG